MRIPGIGKCTPLLAILSALTLYQGASATEFQGTIGRTEAESTPWWPPETRAPEGSPNILIWMLDDIGFGHIASFGGLVETPHLDQLAGSGLQFTNFHATPLCSPTRATTLSGRNPHAIGMGAHARAR